MQDWSRENDVGVPSRKEGFESPILHQLNTNQKGNIGIGKAIEHFTSKGCAVSIPLTDTQKYDLIIDTDSTLLRVQVKNIYTTIRGKYRVGLRTVFKISKNRIVSRNFQTADYDLLFIFSPLGIYIIPSQDIKVTNLLTLSATMEKYRVI